MSQTAAQGLAPGLAPASGRARRAIARVTDSALEVTVVGGFGSPGPGIRRRLFSWQARFGHVAQFHSMPPGWAETPGVRDSLPTFRTFTQPLPRTQQEGADTITWLAGVDPIPGPNGSFWLDRRPRGTVRMPRMSSTEAEGRGLWDLVCQQAGAAPTDPVADTGS